MKRALTAMQLLALTQYAERTDGGSPNMGWVTHSTSRSLERRGLIARSDAKFPHMPFITDAGRAELRATDECKGRGDYYVDDGDGHRDHMHCDACGEDHEDRRGLA